MTDITAHPEEEQDPPCYVSTGELPEPQKVRELLEKAHQLFSGDTTGEISNVYPALAKVPPDLFGLCVVGASGNVFGHGDWEFDFTIMSVSKPFVFALMAELRGAADLRARIGVNATGYPFNSLAAVERHPQGLTNPMVNSGAIATTSLGRERIWKKNGPFCTPAFPVSRDASFP
jgi:glutaminase